MNRTPKHATEKQQTKDSDNEQVERHKRRNADQDANRGALAEGAHDENSNARTSPAGDQQFHTQEEVVMAPEAPEVDKDDQLHCDAEINQNHAAICTQQLEIDKQLLTLSSGLIVLSLTFAKDVASKHPTSVWLLISGLIIVAACIACVLFSFRWSIAGLEKAEKYWRARHGDTYGKHSFPTKHNASIKSTNVTASWLFGIGFAAITLFVTLNITKEIDMGITKFKDGSPLKLPITTAPGKNETAGSTIKLPLPQPMKPTKQ